MLRHLALLALVSSLASCGDDDLTPRTAADTGATVDSTPANDTAVTETAPGDTGGEAAAPINDCADSDYVDATSSEMLRTFDAWSVATGKRCLRIKVGQSVTWVPEGGFAVHPLEADSGDSPTPIMLVNTGTTATVAFPNAGTYGYHCANHPGVMKGAIRAVP